jgi:hypothetical protein
MTYRAIPEMPKAVFAPQPSRPEVNIGTFGDVETARAYIRANSLNVAMSTDVVASISGDSRVTSTTTFDPGDSGSNGFYVVYRGTNEAGSARTLGSSVVTGWSLWSGSIYRANVGTGLGIHTMWEDGARGRKARSPKLVIDPLYPMAQATYRTSEGVAASHTVIQYASGNYSPGSWTLTDAQVVIWSGGGLFGAATDWFKDTVPITSLNLGARQFTLDESTRYQIFGSVGSRYFIQGVIDLLTEAGEFHYDSTAGYLYYIFNGDPSTAVVEIPRVTRVFSFEGDDETTRTKYIKLDNLGIEQSNFTDWYRFAWVNDGDSGEGHTYPSYDRAKELAANRQGAVYLENADHVVVTRCHIKNAGYSGVYFENYNQNHTVSDCLIEDSGVHAVCFDGKYPGEGDVSKNNAVTNCQFQRMGQLVGHGAGIWIMNSGSNTFTSLDISDGPRNGIGIYAYVDIPQADIYARNNRVQYTYMHALCQDSGDAGAMGIGGLSSLTGGPYVTNYVNQVIVDNVNAHTSMLDVDPNGLFTDNQTYGQNIANMVISDTQGALYRIAADSGEHTFTNVNFTGAFNAALIDTPNIGLRPEFPF